MVPLLAMPWGDPLTVRAPVAGQLSTDHGLLMGVDDGWFGRVRGGGPLTDPGDDTTLGLTADAAWADVWTSDGRNVAGIRGFGADLWMTHRDDQGVHSFVVRGRLPGPAPIATTWTLSSATEAAAMLSLVYDGYAEAGPVAVSIEARLGYNSAIAVDAAGSLVLIVPIGDRLAIEAGATAGLVAYGAAIGGVRLRPARTVELGLSVGHAFPVLMDSWDRTAPYGVLELEWTAPAREP